MSGARPALTAIAVAALATLLFVPMAGATADSERLTSKGLIAFHAGNYAEALAAFDAAVDADGDDAQALYYQGVTHERLGDFAAAAASLRDALARKPGMPEAALELGYALFRVKKYRDAIPWLEQAQHSTALEARASFFLGVSQMHLDDHVAARVNLRRAAAAGGSLIVPARYYQGVSAFRAGDWQRAQEHFVYVAAEQAGSEMGVEAEAFLDNMATGRVRNYQVYGEVAFEYDSNVPALPSDSSARSDVRADQGVTGKDDGRNTLTAGVWYVPLQRERMQISLGYEFFQSLHFDLDDFDIQDHRARVAIANGTGRFEYGLSGQYDYYFLETNSFNSEVSALPWLRLLFGAAGDTEVYYRFRNRDFKRRDFNRLNSGDNHAVGLRHTVPLGSAVRTAWLGYRFDHENADKSDGNVFAYDGQLIETGLTWDLPFAVGGEASYSYNYRDYDNASDGRDDNAHRVSVSLSRPLGEYFTVVGRYFGDINKSDKNEFDYNRHVGTIALQVRY